MPAQRDISTVRSFLIALVALAMVTPAATVLAADAPTTPASSTGDDRPDLVVTNVSVEPWAPEEGEKVLFHARVENQGNTSAANFTVNFTLDSGRALGSMLVSGLGPGESAWVTSEAWNATAGDHLILAMADATRTVNETEERNNELGRWFTVTGPALPDLVVRDIDWRPSKPADGDAVAFAVTVANVGNASAANFTVVVGVSGTSWNSTAFVADVPAGESVHIVFENWTAREGEHNVFAIADVTDTVDESDDWNNRRDEWIVVAPASETDLPDLRVNMLERVNADTSMNATRFVALVENHGTAPAGNFTVRFLVDGAHLGDVRVRGLAPGESTWVPSPTWAATPGEHLAVAVADPENVVNESREDNNARDLRFVVLEPVDLATRILDVERNPVRTDVAEGPASPVGRRTIVVETCNAGPGDAVHARVNLWTATRDVTGSPTGYGAIDSVYVPNLPAGACRVLEVDWYPTGIVGDVDVHARIMSSAPDVERADNTDRYRDFVLVGGFGGYHVPFL